MDPPPIKSGYLYRPQKGIKKYWVKRWALLYPGSECNPPRLETFDSKEASCKEGIKPTVLSLPSPIKAFPTSQHRSRDFVIEIKMDDKNVTFAVDTREELNSWLQVMSEVSNGRTGKRDYLPAEPPSSSTSFSGEAAEGLQENTLYDSFETMAYPVSIKPTTFSECLGLQGYYSLQIDSVKLSLIDEDSSDILYAWPYRYLRRYGRDKVSFSMEAGRKCDSGPGLLVFETKDGNDIFHNIQNFVNSISGRKATPVSHSRQQEPQHIQAGKAAPLARPTKTKSVLPQPPVRSHPKDPIGAIAESSIFQQKLAAIKITKDEARVADYAPRKPKPFKARQVNVPRSPSPSTQVDPLYSEVQEGVDTQSNNPPSPGVGGEYSLLQDSEQPRLPPIESSAYDMPEPPGNTYNMTVEEPRSDSWKTFGRTEDNIHTETYISNESLLEEDSKADPKPVSAPVKPNPLRPKPQIRQKPKVNMTKPETPEPKKEPVLSDANETLYDVCGSAPEVSNSPSVSEGDDVYDHFTRTNISQPVPAPRKVIPPQSLPQVDDDLELYDHLQRETNVGGSRGPIQLQSQQRSYDTEDMYDSLIQDSGNQNVAGGTDQTLPEESEYSTAVLGSHMYMEAVTQPTTDAVDTDENPYDIVSFQ